MTTFTEYQQQLNRSTAGAWDWFETHRSCLWTVIEAAVEQQSTPHSLCLLGAGNINDIDLNLALTLFEFVELVDVDGEAMREGVARQGLEGSERIRLHGKVDLRHERLEGQSFDVVVSCCMLSQLVDRIVQELGPDHPDTLRTVLRERDRHLKTLIPLTTPGGAAILATDFVSSDTASILLSATRLNDSQVARFVADGNFFTGHNPYVLRLALEALPGVEHVTPLPAWIWRVGPNRTFAVSALLARRSAVPQQAFG